MHEVTNVLVNAGRSKRVVCFGVVRDGPFHDIEFLGVVVLGVGLEKGPDRTGRVQMGIGPKPGKHLFEMLPRNTVTIAVIGEPHQQHQCPHKPVNFQQRSKIATVLFHLPPLFFFVINVVVFLASVLVALVN